MQVAVTSVVWGPMSRHKALFIQNSLMHALAAPKKFPAEEGIYYVLNAELSLMKSADNDMDHDRPKVIGVTWLHFELAPRYWGRIGALRQVRCKLVFDGSPYGLGPI
jgi:hypothetical protein